MSSEDQHVQCQPLQRTQCSQFPGSPSVRKGQRFSIWSRPEVSLECETPNRAHTDVAKTRPAACCFAPLTKILSGTRRGVRMPVQLDHASDEDDNKEDRVEVSSHRSAGMFGAWRTSRISMAGSKGLRGSLGALSASSFGADIAAALRERRDSERQHPLCMEDVMALIIQKLDVVRTIHVRLVSKDWNSLLKRAGLDPIERVTKADRSERKQAYKTVLLIRAFCEERVIFGNQALLPASARMETKSGVASTTELLLEMSARRELHNTNESAFLTSVQLADRFVSYESASSRRFPAVCAAALRIACFTEQKRELQPEVLAALTHRACTSADVVQEERNIREAFAERRQPLVLTTAMDFLPHFLRAAELDGSMGENDWTVARALVFYFVSILLLDTKLRRLRPSLMSAAAVSCALMVLGRPAWSEALSFASCYSAAEVEVLVRATLSASKRVCCIALDRKFDAVAASDASPESSLCAQVRSFLAGWRARDATAAVSRGGAC